MSVKHYNANYLEDTGAFFRSLKEFSYSPFTSLKKGHIVDLGCGTGLDVLALAGVLGPNVNVTGIDHDQNMLDKGIESCAGLANVQFKCANALPIPFEDAALDGLRAERLIQHLQQPEMVFTEIHRTLKPGSPVVIVETDWPGLLFYNEHTAIERKIIDYLTGQKVNNGFAARKLISYLNKAGFNKISIEVFPFVLKSVKQADEYLWFDKILKETEANQVISQQEYDLFFKSLQDAEAGGYFACSMNMVVVSAVK